MVGVNCLDDHQRFLDGGELRFTFMTKVHGNGGYILQASQLIWLIFYVWVMS